jgi:acyl carrier protein
VPNFAASMFLLVNQKVIIMLSPQIIEKQLITIVAKSLQIPEKMVSLQSSLMNDLEAESIDILDIRFAIEQQFRFKFDNNEIKNILMQFAAERKLGEKDIPRLFTVEALFNYIILKTNMLKNENQ